MDQRTPAFRILLACSAFAIAGFAKAGEPNADALTFRELHTVLQVPTIDRPLAIALAVGPVSC